MILKKHFATFFLFFLSTLFFLKGEVTAAPTSIQSEKEISLYIQKVIDTKKALEKSHPVEKKVFLYFADFDGTIIHGDMTEGEPHGLYKGITELALLAGYSRYYLGADGFKRYHQIYEEMKVKDPLGSCYFTLFPFLELDPLQKESLQNLIETHFKKVLSHFIYHGSEQVISQLQEENIIPHVISASQELFVQGVRHLTNFKAPFTRRQLSGFSTEDRIANYGKGKTLRMKKIVESYEAEGFTVFVVGGMGNSYSSDGPFLKEIEKKYAGISLMINGGNIPESFQKTNFFRYVFTSY